MDHDWGAIKYARADGLDLGIVVVRVTSGIRLCLIAISNPKWLVQKLRGRRIKGTAEEARSVVSKVQVFASTTQVLELESFNSPVRTVKLTRQVFPVIIESSNGVESVKTQAKQVRIP